MINDPKYAMPDRFMGLEQSAMHPGGVLVPSEPLTRYATEVHNHHAGKTFIQNGRDDHLTMWEGFGLKPFQGLYVNPNLQPQDMTLVNLEKNGEYMLFYKLAQQDLPAPAARQQALSRQGQVESADPNAKLPSQPQPVAPPQETGGGIQGMPPQMTPSQQIMAKLQQDQIYQYNLKMQDLAQKAQTGVPLTFAQMIQQQREQQGIQEQMAKKQVMVQQATMELQNIMPRQTVQNSDQVMPLDPNRKMQLEQIYATLGQQVPGQPPIISQTTEQILNQGYTRPFQGQFINVNADAPNRILKERTTTVPAL